jgi:hypothetical protein
MRKVLFFLSIFFVILSTSIVIAECPPDCDYANPDVYTFGTESYNVDIYSYADSYSNPDFLANSDASQWDYSSADMYANFANIPADQYGEIDWGQFNFNSPKFNFGSVKWDQVQDSPNFHQSIAHNTKGGLDKYMAEYGLTSDTFSMQGTSTEKISFGDGAISTKSGSVTFAEHSDAKFIVKDDGEIRVIYSSTVNVDTSTFSEGTSGTFIFPSDGDASTIQTGEREVPVDGRLIYQDGIWHIPPGETSTINGLAITNNQGYASPVYGVGSNEFAELERSGNYREIQQKISADIGGGAVYVGENTFIVARDCDVCDSTRLREPTVEVKVTSENTYGIEVKNSGDDARVELVPYGDGPRHGAQEYNDHLVISAIDGGFIYTRDEGAAVYGNVDLENGHREVTFDDGSVYSKAAQYGAITLGSVPMEIAVYRNDGTNPNSDIGLSNVVTFGDNQNVHMGEPPISHFSVIIDPYKLIDRGDPDELRQGEAVTVTNELALSGAKKPFLIVTTPETDPAILQVYGDTAELYERNAPSGMIPMIIEMEGDQNAQIQANEFFFSDVVDTRSDGSLVATQSALYSSSGLNPKVELKIIGHSNSEFVTAYTDSSGTTYVGGASTGGDYVDIETLEPNILFDPRQPGLREELVRIVPVRTGNSGQNYLFITQTSRSSSIWKDSPVGCNIAADAFYSERGQLLTEAASAGGVAIGGENVHLVRGSSREVAGREADYSEEFGLTTHNIRDVRTRELLQQELQTRMEGHPLSDTFLRFDVAENSNSPTLLTVGAPGISADQGALQASAIVDSYVTFNPEYEDRSSIEILRAAREDSDSGEFWYDCSQLGGFDVHATLCT